MGKKTTNNNKSATMHNKNQTMHKSHVQTTLDGDIMLNPKFRLNENSYLLLESFYLVGESSYSQFQLTNLFAGKMHRNTVSNNLRDLERRGFIDKLGVLPGKVIQSLYFYKKVSARLEDGGEVSDLRQKHYKITPLGRLVFELNGKTENSETKGKI